MCGRGCNPLPRLGAAIQRGAESGLGVVKLTPHARVLRTLSGEKEGDFRFAFARRSAAHPSSGGLVAQEGGELIATKPMYAGKFSATFRLSGNGLQIATIRTNAYSAAPPQSGQTDMIETPNTVRDVSGLICQGSIRLHRVMPPPSS